MTINQLTIGALALGLTCFTFAENDTQKEARNHAMLLGKTLKSELHTTMVSDGPLAAIKVCNEKAVPLTAQITEQSGWNVGRTSLKVRNPANQADVWEQAQMQEFDRLLSAGQAPATLEVFQETQKNGKTVQRFMKAIPVEAGCLACHGDAIIEPVRTKLDQLYPDDKARGYSLGQLRGAFTLQRVVD